MMSTDIFLKVRTSDGRVVNACVGCPPASDGYDYVPREGLAADAWIRWTRQEDGTFEPPVAPDEGGED